MILTLKTDNPEAEIGLFSPDGSKLAYEKWQAHRELEATIFDKIQTILGSNKLEDLTGVIIYAGPGSFTGLRIGFAVSNALAYGLQIPNVKSDGENWIKRGLDIINQTKKAQILLPNYGGEANITKPKK